MQRIIGLDRLHSFCERHADCRKWIANWIVDVKNSTWATPQDIKDRYHTASLLADNVTIFNVRGNDYRLEVQVAFAAHVVVVRWIGTHAEYTKRNRK